MSLRKQQHKMHQINIPVKDTIIKRLSYKRCKQTTHLFKIHFVSYFIQIHICFNMALKLKSCHKMD